MEGMGYRGHRVATAVRLRSKGFFKVDIRFVGDNYIDPRWMRSIITHSELHPLGFHVPNSTNHFFALLYHDLVHKGRIIHQHALMRLADPSQRVMLKRGQCHQCSLLVGFLEKHGYTHPISDDPSVGKQLACFDRSICAASPSDEVKPTSTSYAQRSTPAKLAAECYAGRYGDLHQLYCPSAGGCNVNALHKHFLIKGRNEGRRFGCGDGRGAQGTHRHRAAASAAAR